MTFYDVTNSSHSVSVAVTVDENTNNPNSVQSLICYILSSMYGTDSYYASFTYTYVAAS
jgi:hypothetical protein